MVTIIYYYTIITIITILTILTFYNAVRTVAAPLPLLGQGAARLVSAGH